MFCAEYCGPSDRPRLAETMKNDQFFSILIGQEVVYIVCYIKSLVLMYILVIISVIVVQYFKLFKVTFS